MSFIDILLIAFALSLDAFSASLTCGIKLHAFKLKKYLKISIFFGLFQFFMPLLGFFLGSIFQGFLSQIAYAIAVLVFLILALKTIKDAFGKEKKNCENCNCEGYSCVTSLAIATSIDALAVGVVLALLQVSLLQASLIIGIVAFLMSLLGNLLGNRLGAVFKSKANILAGLILLALAIKLFVEKIV